MALCSTETVICDKGLSASSGALCIREGEILERKNVREGETSRTTTMIVKARKEIKTESERERRRLESLKKTI